MMRSISLAVLLLSSVIAARCAGAATNPATCASNEGPTRAERWVRGVALGLFATDPEWDYGPLLDEIAARNATDVLVVVNAYQSDRFASDIALRPGLSPSLNNVARTLRQVRARGMRPALMPVVGLHERAAEEWRGVLAPADGLDAWFLSYERFVLPLASVAQRAGAVRLVVGSELGSLEPYADHWRTLIGHIRSRFSRVLSYSANWDRIDAVPFWDALDEVGVTAYFPLASTEVTHASVPSAEALAAAWRAPRKRITALRERVGRPVVITEVGYPSRRGAAARPWDDTTSEPVDLALQARLYEGFCGAFRESASIEGFYVWNWFGFGGPRDAGYSPRGKPAAAALAACFTREPT